MKQLFLTFAIVISLTVSTFGYDKGLFDLDYFGDLKVEFQVAELESNGEPGLVS